MSQPDEDTRSGPSRSRRILHLIDTGGPGGAETVFFELVTRLPAHGWEAVAIVPEEDWLYGALQDAGVSARVVPAEGSFDVSYLRSLHRIIRANEIALVQAHLLSSGVYASIASMVRPRPVVTTFHGRPDISGAQRFVRLKVGLLRKPGNRTVCVSESLRDHFVRAGYVEPTAEVIPNGIDLDSFRPGRAQDVRSELGIPADVPLIGAVGNVRPSKVYGVLLTAFARIRDWVPEARLVIAGQADGPMFDELQCLQQGLGLADSCRFLGFREDVPELLRAMDVFVLSSSDEGFSLVTVQAMASGLPVVATRCGGPEEILGQSGAGVLVPPGDPTAIADAVVRVLRTPGLATELGDAGRRRAEAAFSIDSMVRRYSELYDRCLAF